MSLTTVLRHGDLTSFQEHILHLHNVRMANSRVGSISIPNMMHELRRGSYNESVNYLQPCEQVIDNAEGVRERRPCGMRFRAERKSRLITGLPLGMCVLSFYTSGLARQEELNTSIYSPSFSPHGGVRQGYYM